VSQQAGDQRRSPYPPGASDSRRSLERSSARVLLYLHQLPRWLPPVVLAALLLAGLTVHGPVGAIALVLVAVFLGWLAALSWPRLSPPARLLRVLAVCGLLTLAVYQALR
jgi:uncharacterized protein DUF6703